MGFFSSTVRLACVIVGLATFMVTAAHAQVFSNPAPIAIPDSVAAAPFPSTITVAGFVGQPLGIRVRVKNLTHTFMNDVAVLLVAPSGQGVQLLNFNGGNVSGITLTFGAESTTPLPQTLITGTFAPSEGTQSFSTPANAIPRAASLATLAFGNPNGVWRLFVQDFVGGDSGSIANGWEIEFGDFGFVPTPLTEPAVFTYQGRLEGAAANGTIDARFSLWSSPIGNLPINRLREPFTVSAIPVTNSLFTTPVNLGGPVPTDIQTWLQVEVASPAGSAFVPLTPRQPITATPLAGVTASLGSIVTFPAGDTVITGPQGVGVTGTLTIRAPGGVNDSSGAQGGTLRLIAGNANASGAQAPPVGTSLNNNLHIIAGDNAFIGSFGNVFNGNIQFFAGDGQPERMRLVGDNGFVGIGTTNPVQRLDVRGSIALGANGELRAASGVEDLRMLRGTLTSTGAISAGQGFTAFRSATGVYFVGYDTPFSGEPTVTASAFGSTLIVNVAASGPNGVTLTVRNPVAIPTDAAVNFIVMGPR